MRLTRTRWWWANGAPGTHAADVLLQRNCHATWPGMLLQAETWPEGARPTFKHRQYSFAIKQGHASVRWNGAKAHRECNG